MVGTAIAAADTADSILTLFSGGGNLTQKETREGNDRLPLKCGKKIIARVEVVKGNGKIIGYPIIIII